jgi:PAS domain S-box-containing protein
LPLSTSSATISLPAFLQGGGEMGRLTREKDWSTTSLGDISEWPQSLVTTLSIVLHSKFPMFLWWGPELICFYNDAYRPSLGNNGKHPFILGMPAKQAWPEIWEIIKPLIDQVLQGGDATWSEDQLIPIYRNGELEDVYWTFSYSPVNDESGKVAGVFVTCTESTNKVLALKKMEESEQRFRNTVMQAPVGITIISAKDFIVEMANQAYLSIVDKTEKEFVGRSLFDSLPETTDLVEPLLINVIKTGIPYFGTEFEVPIIRYGKSEKAYFNFVYQPLHRDDGEIKGVIVIANEVTKLVAAKHSLQESERKFSQMLMQSPIAVTVIRGKDYIVEMANTEMLTNIWGKAADEVIGKSLLEIFPEVRDQRYPALLDKVFDTGTIHRETEAATFIKRGTGIKKFYLDFEYSPLLDQEEKVSGIMITVYDVTEKVEARLKIEESEKKFRLLADSMPQHIWTSDIYGKVNYYNKSLYDFSGLTLEELHNDGWIQIVHPDEREKNVSTWMHAVANGEPFLFEHRFRRYDGQYRWQLSRALPVRDADGKIQMWVGTSTDIDEIKKHQQEKDDFIKIASHELKTPVTTIKAYVQLLLNQDVANENTFLKKSLATIDKQITRLVKLITDLLDVTKIEMGSFEFNKEALSLNDLLKDVTENIQATTQTHRITLEMAENAIVFADKDRLTQVVANLLTNAIKYSPGADKVIVSTRISEVEVIVAVRDFGIGILNNEHERIFERFYRAQNSYERSFPGFGIGLFIVKEIITNHNGRVWVHSEKNKGSTFYFSLPVS